MGQILSERHRNNYPLTCLKLVRFVELTEDGKKSTIETRVKQINEFLRKKHGDSAKLIKIETKQTAEETVRFLNKTIRSIRDEPETITTFVIELYEELVRIKDGDYRGIHNDIEVALEVVPNSSIRRIVSLCRSNKLR